MPRLAISSAGLTRPASAMAIATPRSGIRAECFASAWSFLFVDVIGSMALLLCAVVDAYRLTVGDEQTSNAWGERLNRCAQAFASSILRVLYGHELAALGPVPRKSHS
jgi:hypothetical protein